ncbi:hypothetical protein OEZ86_009090 [Tetradesmus obliquus]|nr:hypothetical protein OEZ86_009090 [Tetradesmus obliquus]
MKKLSSSPVRAKGSPGKWKLQLAQGLEAEKERRTTLDHYVSQVELLQTAFTSLADAVLEELDELASERVKVQREQAAWSSSVQQLEQNVQAKLSSLGRLEERLDIKLAVAAELPGQLEGLARQQRSDAAGMEGLRAEVRSLQVQLGRLERGAALAKSEAAVAPLNPTQLSHVKDLAHDAVREQVPGLEAATISSHVPAMIDEVVEQRCGELRRDFTSTADMLAADLSRLAKDGASLRGDVCSIAAGLKRSEADLAALGSRLGRMEVGEASNPKASLRLLSALEDKIESAAAQQSRYSKSVESVVSALVDDTVTLNKRVGGMEGLVSRQQGQLQDTKEALLRSAQVFSSMLKVPSPVSSTLWSSPSRSHGTAGAAAAAASAHGSPVRSGSAGGSPMLSSKYSSFLSRL